MKQKRKRKAWWWSYRSAITGRYVSKTFAEANHETTVRERVEAKVMPTPTDPNQEQN